MAIITHYQRRKTAANRFDLADRADNRGSVTVTPGTRLTDYLAQLMPGIEAECEGNCIRVVPISQMVAREGRKFCSAQCADRECAPMIKPQPKGQKVDGWDV